MEFSSQKIDEAALALLYVTLHEDSRAWKSIDWDAMDRLFQKGLILNPANKTKSVIFTEAGLKAALAAAEKLFR